MGSFGLIYMKLSYISKICKDLEFFPRWFCTPLIPRNWFFYSRCVLNSKNNYFQTASTHFLVKSPKIATTTKTLFISFALLSSPYFYPIFQPFPYLHLSIVWGRTAEEDKDVVGEFTAAWRPFPLDDHVGETLLDLQVAGLQVLGAVSCGKRKIRFLSLLLRNFSLNVYFVVVYNLLS